VVTADVVETDVHALRGRGGELGGQVAGPVVQGRVEAQVLE
jgi:hypothetical protein